MKNKNENTWIPQRKVFNHPYLLETNLNGFDSIMEAGTRIDFFVRRREITPRKLKTSARNKL